jgi:hypothetical protein
MEIGTPTGQELLRERGAFVGSVLFVADKDDVSVEALGTKQFGASAPR